MAVYNVALLGLQAFLQFLGCMQLYWISRSLTETHVQTFIVLLLIPLLFYFVIFSIVLYSWTLGMRFSLFHFYPYVTYISVCMPHITVAHSMDKDAKLQTKRWRKLLYVVNATITVIFLVVIILLFTGNEFYYVGQIALCAIIVLFTVAFIGFSLSLFLSLRFVACCGVTSYHFKTSHLSHVGTE